MATSSGTFSVKVYFPTGVPVVIKATPKTSILEILKEACANKKVNPDEYNLKYNKNILDISSTIHFSRISNNGRLDAVKSDILRFSSDVKIRLQLENGERRQGQFSSDTNLQKILNDLKVEYNKNTAVIFYLQNKISGKDFETVTLSFLGLNSSGATLRLTHENPEKPREQAHVYDIRIPSKNCESIDCSSVVPSSSIEQNPKDSELKVDDEGMDCSSLPLPLLNEHDLKDSKLKEDDKDMDCSSLPSSSSATPMPKYHISDLKKKNFDFISAFKSEKQKRKIACGGNVIKPQKKEEEKQIKIEENARAVVEEEPTQEPISLLQPMIHILDEERQAVIFNQAQAVRRPEPELPDDFFNVTERDAIVYQKGLREKLKENDRPLITEKLREAEKEKLMNALLEKHPKACIKIVINQEFELQGIFRSTEIVKDVKNFVKAYLVDSTTDFSLYIPPRMKLNDQNSLLEEHLVPRAKVYCTKGCDIDPKFKSKLTDPLAANKIRLNNDLPDCSDDPKKLEL